MTGAGPMLVCSNKPRPSVQKTRKGSQFWRRDVHHIRASRMTYCGVDASEWLEIGAVTSQAADDPGLCRKCKRMFFQ